MEEFLKSLKRDLKKTPCCKLGVSFALSLLIFILLPSGGGLLGDLQKIDSIPWRRLHCANSHMCL